MSERSADIISYGERGWLARLGATDDVVASGVFANRVADAVRNAAGVTDAVAGIESVAIRFDPARLDPDSARALLAEAIEKTAPPAEAEVGEPIDIPVCYGGEFGPDLADLAKRAGLSQEDAVKVHAAQTYRVATLGFAPGFAYLGPLDERLRAPRLDAPRAAVPAGAVGVAGPFTCIYPLPSPGGWRLIGRTPKRLFDPTADNPFILKPGVRIRFHAIDRQIFDAQAQT